MRTKLSWVDGIIGIVWLLPLVYLWYVYPTLPDRLALHFDYKGDPNRWGSKRELITTVTILLSVSLGVSLLLRFLPRIDPKKKAQYSEGAFIKISYALIFLFSSLNVVCIYSSIKGHFALNTHLLLPAICLLMAYIGNLFNNIKPNYFFGIRTPWTLENETVWRKTHQMGGRLWLCGGLIMAILTFLLNEDNAWICFSVGISILALVPIAYSYICYRKLQRIS